jgi:hypothetical protein
LQFKAGKISNLRQNKNISENLKINASSQLFNKAKLTAVINFDLNSKDYFHTVSGSLENLPLNTFNAMVEKSAPVTIESGQLKKFKFDVSFNENLGTGQLFFGYENFKISLLDFSDDEVKKSKFASFWANKMVLNTNTDKKDELLPIELNYKRDPHRSIINLWWKTIYSGAKTTIGLDNK